MSRKMLSSRSHSIEGRVALVTGGASGIGRSVCHVLSDYGAKIAVVDLGIERCNAVAKEVNDCHGANSARAYECDVKDMAQVQKTTDTIAKDFGKIDFLINCAGINGIRTLLTQDTTETTISAFQNVLEVNLTGTLRFIAACTPYLIASTSNGAGVGPEPDGTSRIVNISSIAGLNTTGGLGYDSSKHGVLAITKGAAAELGPKGVTVNAICPGLILTAMTATRHDAFRELGKLTPAKRAGEPEDIAQAVWWLCTPAAGFVNGENLVVDGGLTKLLAANWPYATITGTWDQRLAAEQK